MIKGFQQFWALLNKCPAMRDDNVGKMFVMTADGVAVLTWDTRKVG